MISAAAAVTIAALLLIVLCLSPRRSRIVYRDRSLEYWFSQTLMTMVKTNGAYSKIVRIDDRLRGSYGCTMENPREMPEVFLAIGTNCLPFLVKKLGAHETAISTAWSRAESALHFKRGFVPNASLERGQAVTALIWIDRLPAETMEKIKALSKSIHPEVAASAKHVLENCHKAPAASEPER